MKYLSIGLLLILILSCSENNETSEFKDIIGESNYKTLDTLVSDFENSFLKKQYPNLETNKAYEKFLIQISNGKEFNWIKLLPKSHNRFHKSDLRLEMYNFPDSVWVVQNSSFDKVEEDSLSFLDIDRPYIKVREQGRINNKEYQYRRVYAKLDSTNVDSLVNIIKNQKSFNYTGNYYKAIDKFKNENKFWNEFNEYIVSPKKYNPAIFADMVLKNNLDLNNKTIRKFIVLECVY